MYELNTDTKGHIISKRLKGKSIWFLFHWKCSDRFKSTFHPNTCVLWFLNPQSVQTPEGVYIYHFIVKRTLQFYFLHNIANKKKTCKTLSATVQFRETRTNFILYEIHFSRFFENRKYFGVSSTLIALIWPDTDTLTDGPYLLH